VSPPGLPDAVSVTAGRAVSGGVRTPGDKSISHRALLIGALADGTTTVRGLSDGDDVARTEAAVRAFGATVHREQGVVSIEGGRDGLHQAAGPLDCANSGTSMRLLVGVAAGRPWQTTLTGDRSLSARPMDRVAEPIAAMGATVEGSGPTVTPPLTVHGGGLRGIEWSPPMASAQVKSAILFAGLEAEGETVVREAVATRAHTEEMLAAAGADIAVERWGRGRLVRVRPSRLRPLVIDVPGDPSQAAFWVVAGCVCPDSRVVVERVYAGPDRLGFMGVLERMGASVRVGEVEDGAADLHAESAVLAGTEVEAAEIPSLDEIPILAVAAAAATGTTTFRDVSELTVKESDRLATTIALVEALGARARAVGEDLVVEGRGRPGSAPVRFDSHGDHRLAMAAIVGAMAGPGGRVGGTASIGTSYPGFLADLDALTGGGVWAAG
jgi:3-phosphoshikimate 1-carboxyvinyltransferase